MSSPPTLAFTGLCSSHLHCGRCKVMPLTCYLANCPKKQSVAKCIFPDLKTHILSFQGTRARIFIIVWIKCTSAGWISATAAVQIKEAAAARSAWLPHTLHKGASGRRQCHQLVETKSWSMVVLSQKPVHQFHQSLFSVS